MADVHDESTGGQADGLNRRQALGLAGAAAAGAVGASVLSAPAAAASSRDDRVVPMHSVSLELAKEIIEAAIEFVRDNEFPPMYILVVDVCGDEKASARMDGNGAASVGLVPAKARTAAAFRTATLTLGQNAADDPARIASFTTAGFSLLGGGVPIVVDEMVVGAVGVGGGSPEQDHEVATAAIAEALD